LIQKDGFDGIIAGSEIVLFNSNQIKLSDGKNTTFNSNTNDIRFDAGGEVKKTSKFGKTTIETPLDTLNESSKPNKLYVKITREEALELSSREYGITSGKRDKETGERETIYFCSNLVFIRNFERENKEFIEI
jgi:hypothetical protein